MNAIMSVAMTANEVRRWTRQDSGRQAVAEIEGTPMPGADDQRTLRRSLPAHRR
jgi:hypothetical protein